MHNENSEENYISAVLGQIRWKKARPVIQKELEGHIEEHRQEAKNCGLDDAAALDKAVIAMGDPLETGRRLDRLHRPRVDVPMVASAAILIAFTLTLVVYSILAQYSEPDYLQSLAVTFVGFGIGIAAASVNIRRIIAKASFVLVIGGLAGLLGFSITTRLILFPIYNTSVTSDVLSMVDWIDLAQNCFLLVFLMGLSGWVARLKRGDIRRCVLAVSAVIAAVVLFYLAGQPTNMACTVFACLLIFLCSQTDKKWKIVLGVLSAVVTVYMVLLYFNISAHYVELNKTNHSIPLVQTALQHLKDLKLIGYAIPAPSKAIYSAFSDPFGFMLLHYGILPALLPYAAIGVLIWRLLRSPLHIHDRIGRALASGASIYFAVRFILTLLTDVFSMGMINSSIPFIPTWGQEPALVAGLLGLLFGLYRRKELYHDAGDRSKGNITGVIG